ncbi:hypothetical protein BH11PLA2_BH11PLA2_30610 [soil metagenome]
MESNSTKAYYDAAEVAEYFSVSFATVRRWLESGELASKKFGGCRRIPLESLQQFAEAKAKQNS